MKLAKLLEKRRPVYTHYSVAVVVVVAEYLYGAIKTKVTMRPALIDISVTHE